MRIILSKIFFPALSALLVFSLFSSGLCFQSSTIHIILDSSAGMNSIVNNKAKHVLAREFIEKLLNSGVNSKLGLTVFGSEAESGINAFYTPVPPSLTGGRSILDELSSISPAGLSPIASALYDAANSLDPSDSNHIILITDGVENAGGAPVSTVEELMKNGIITNLDIVGFSTDVFTNPLISEMIFMSGGSYSPAWGADPLITTLNTVQEVVNEDQNTGFVGYRSFIKEVNSFPAFGTVVELRDASGKIIQKKTFWRGIFEDIVPGDYTLSAINGTKTQSQGVKVFAGLLTENNFIFNFKTGNLFYRNTIQGTNDGKAFGAITKIYHETGETVHTGTAWSGMINNLPEGVYTAEGVYEGLAPKAKEIEVREDSLAEVNFEYAVGKGRVGFKCFLDSLEQRVANGTVVRLYRLPYLEIAAEMNMWRGTTPNLPIGSYKIEGKYQELTRSREMTIYPDSTSEISFIFNVSQIRLNLSVFRNKTTMAPANGANVVIINQNGQVVEQISRWRGTFNLAEGIYTIQATLNGVTIKKTLNLFVSGDARTHEEELYFEQ